MMTEVGGKLKAGLFAASVALFGVLAFSARTADLVKIKGEACEKFVPGQSKSSIRVRVTDKASYKAVSQVESLSELRSSMLEHDFNVIVYNLVDNYVQDLMVRTVSQNDNKLCVKVTGAIPAADIVTVIANYSPHNPAPEYDIKEAAGIEEEVLTEADDPVAAESREPDSEVLYDGREELAAEQETEVGSETGNEEPAVVYGGEAEDEANDYLTAGELPPPPENLPEPETAAPTVSVPVKVAAPAAEAAAVPAVSEKAYVYVSPVEFNNNTHSSKSAQVLKDMFADTEGYLLVDNPGSAAYVLQPKVLKAKIDALNSQTKRIQMVVSLELKMQSASVSFSEHQNRFVLFENGENEQEIAQKLLHKLLRNSGRKLFAKIEQAESKRKAQGLPQIITPAK